MADKYVTFKDVPGKDILYKNFAGRPTKFVPEGGKRTFKLVFYDLELAHMMAEDGWPVRYYYVDGESEPQSASIEIKVRYNSSNPARNPDITQKTSSHDVTVRLDDSTVGGLDYSEILKAKYITVRGWEYETGKRSVYLSRACFVIDECLDSYRDVSLDDDDEEELPF